MLVKVGKTDKLQQQKSVFLLLAFINLRSSCIAVNAVHTDDCRTGSNSYIAAFIALLDTTTSHVSVFKDTVMRILALIESLVSIILNHFCLQFNNALPTDVGQARWYATVW